ncbi:Ig-like domain-containing protein, partial [Sphingomonas sp. PB2P19]|uniref:Ig-like domain-containing protein n=1 Tax=Sphingomonas rhamnosi TaxID=3096156 RepID=UPI002FCC187F
SFVYTAKTGFVGTDTFTYAASDGHSSSNAKVTLKVSAPAPAPVPVALGDAVSAIAGVAVTGNVLSNDKSGTGAALTSILATGPSHGTLQLASNGSFTYVPDVDFAGTDSFTYSASDGSASAGAKVTITVAAKPNTAPVAMADNAGSVEAGALLTGNVLTNDKDANGDALTAKLINGPAHGTLKLLADGSFVYTANNGYSGADSFTYSASDGKAADTALVSINVTAPPPVSSPFEKLLAAHQAVDGSASSNNVLTGASGANAFYIDVAAKSGNDTVVNLEGSDVLIFSHVLNDNNGDGLITFSGNKLRVDGTVKGDILTLTDVSSLRYLGAAMDGAHVYADGAAKPKSALESVFGDDRLAGDLTDKKIQKFFFDTALGFDLGDDTIVNMGKKDILVTTTALSDGDHDGIVGSGAGAQFDLGKTPQTIGDAGHVNIFNTTGAAVNTLEFDGSVIHDGVSYYVYSLEGSTGGLATLGF